MQLFRFLFLCLFLCPTVTSANDALQVPGTRVELIAPSGFTLSSTFPGLEKRDVSASVMVTELPGPFATLDAGLTAAALGERGMRLESREEVTLADRSGSFLHLVQDVPGGASFQKWMAVFGDDESSVMVVATAPRAVADSLADDLRQCLLSVKWQPQRDIPADEGLAFHIEAPEGLQPGPKMLGNQTFVNNSADAWPLLVVGSSFAEPASISAEKLARRRIVQTEHITHLDQLAGREIRLDGLAGYELVGKARDADSGQELMIFQTLLVDRDRYYLLQGFADSDQQWRWLKRFRKAAETFRRQRPATAASSAGEAPFSPTITEAPPAWMVELEQKCDQGDLEACHNLGHHKEDDPETAERALELFERACAGDVLEACKDAGSMYKSATGTARDLARARTFFERACDGGLAEGCYRLGILYDQGQGVAMDDLHAAELFREGCDGGHMTACSDLGVMYANGEGVARDKAAASRLYQQACDGQYGLACSNLAFLYEDGEGVPQDLERAAFLAVRSCKLDHGAGCYMGARLLLADFALDQLERIVTLLARGCDLESGAACWQLAELMEDGVLLKKNLSKAAGLYTRACRFADEDGCEAARRLCRRDASLCERGAD